MTKLYLPRMGRPLLRVALFVLVLVVPLLLILGAPSAGTPLEPDSELPSSRMSPAGALAPPGHTNTNGSADTATGTCATSGNGDFVIDGRADDWSGETPAATDPQGDTAGGPHTDMKAVYAEMDSDYVYLMVEPHDPPLLSDGTVEFQMDLVDAGGADYLLATHARSHEFFSSWVDTDGDGEPEEWSVTAEEIAWKDVMEAKIPLEQLGGPTRISRIFVNFWCEVDGHGTVPCDDLSSPYDFSRRVDLQYTLTVDNPSSGQATVAMTVSNLSEDVFEVEEHGYHGLYVNVLTLSAHGIGGNPLSVEHRPDSGTTYLDEQADVWSVDCSGRTQVVLEYAVQPGIWSDHGYRGYIAPDFAALAGEYVFLVPRNCVVDSVIACFDLPAGWRVYAPWAETGNGYDPTIPEADAIDSLLISDFALGQFDVFTRTIGTTEVAVAAYAEWPSDVKENLAQRSWDVFAYETSVFGGSVGEHYLGIFCPASPDGHFIYVGEWSTSQGYSVQFEPDGSYWGNWAMFAHQIFHRWNSWAWGMSGYYPWFGEGPAELYEMKTSTELRLPYPYGTVEGRLQGYYEQYLQDYVDTGKDQPLASSSLDTMQIYHKGAMGAFLIAKEIYLRTDGMRNFDDFLQILVQKYGHYAAPCNEECLKAELNTLTGSDFTDFFDDYVYGTIPLPMDWAFEDDDGDGLSNAQEVMWDTHPEDPDTDDDGYGDAVEIRGLTDPLDPASIPHLAYVPLLTRNYVVPALPIEIDGEGADWQSYTPASTDPQGDTTGGPHTDMKAVYAEMGPHYVYLMVEPYDPPLLLDGMVEFQMDLVDSQGASYRLATHAKSGGFFSSWVDTDGDGEPEEWSVTANAIGWRDVMEARIPLQQLRGPTRIDSVFVNFWCEVDGEWMWVDPMGP